MKTKDALYFSICAFLIASSLLYCAVPIFHIRLPRYYPTLKQWKVDPDKDHPSMGWYGRTGFAMLLGAIVGALSYLLFRYIMKVQLPDSSVWYKLTSVMTIASILLALLYILWHEGHRWII